MSEFKITCSIAKAYEKRDGDTIRRFIGGLASGTQVDLEGERMAESAIEAFQKAINEGTTLPDGQWSLIPLRSGHRNEWDDVLGYIVSAEIDKSHNLWIEAELDQENPVAVSLYKKLTKSPEKGKPVKLGLSVGGTVVKAGYELSEETQEFVKTYYDVDLREVSVVAQPAYPTSYLMALNKSVDWDKLKPGGEAAVKVRPTEGTKDQDVIHKDAHEEMNAMNDTPTNIDGLEQAHQAPMESEGSVEKTNTPESEPVAVAEVEKSGMEYVDVEEAAEEVGAPEAENSLDAIAQKVNALAATVELLAAQLGVVTKNHEAEEPQAEVEKAKDAEVPVDLIKQAVLAAMEPVMDRLDRIENEPIDKSYAVMRSKYEDESFESKIEREINAVDGRDAVKRALELAFKS